MTGARGPGAARREYLDWLRGLAVLLMIEAHLLDSWTAPAERASTAFRYAMIVGGTGTTFFLFLAGVAVGLSAGSKERRSGDAGAASTAVVRRGLEIFGLAFLFRLQAWILGWSSNPRDLLKVDILNVMGPAIALAALLWRLSRTARGRSLTLAAAAILAALITPLIRTAPLQGLPDPIEAYILPVAGLSNFVFFPWIALTLAGASAGVLLDAARTAESETRLVRALGLSGAAITAAAYGASFLPSPYAATDFWTTSPAYLFFRVGIMLIAVAAAFAWYHAIVRKRRSPLAVMGQASLFIYWIHVEMVYGLISRPLHRSLPLPHALIAFVLFALLMLVCAEAKTRLTRAWLREPRRRLRAAG